MPSAAAAGGTALPALSPGLLGPDLSGVPTADTEMETALAPLTARRRSVYGLAILLLTGLLGLQYAWLMPADLLQRAPFAQPWLEGAAPFLGALSSRLGWSPTPVRDGARFRVVDRDVRDHPRQPGALLFRATIVNEAAYAQPPPGVRLTLFDTNGGVLGRRLFDPTDYLGGAEAADAVVPGAALQLRLELRAPPVAAISFQVDLL